MIKLKNQNFTLIGGKGIRISISSSANSAIALSYPANFTATGIDADTIRLSWNLVAGSVNYFIQSSSDNNTWSDLTTVSNVTSTYDHNGLSASQTVYYRIKALGDGVIYSDSPYTSASGTTTAGVEDLVWGTVTNITVTGNDLLSTALNARGQADQTLVGDGYVQFTIGANLAVDNNAIIGLDVSSGQTAWTSFDYGIFNFSTDGNIYSAVNGTTTSSGVARIANDILRIHRVGTDMKFYYVRSGTPNLFRTITGVTTATLYIKVEILGSGVSMRDTMKGV